MDRRSVLRALSGLSAGATGILAGCVGHPGEKACLMVEATTPEAAADERSTPIPEVEKDVTVDLSGMVIAEFPDVQAETDRVAEAVLEEETAETVGYRVFERTPYVSVDGEFYEIGFERAEAAEIDRELLVAETVQSATAPVDLQELGHPAYEYVRSAMEGAGRYEAIARTTDDDPREAELLDRAELDQPPALAGVTEQLLPHHPFFAFVFREHAPAREALDLPEYVERNDERLARLVPVEARIEELVFEYTGSHRGATAAEFMAYLAPEIGELPLTATQRAVFEHAIGDGFDPEAGAPDIEMDAYLELITLLDGPYVWFEDELYRVDIVYAHEGEECF